MAVSHYQHLIYTCKQIGTVTHVGSIEGSTDDGNEEILSSECTQKDVGEGDGAGLGNGLFLLLLMLL